MPAATTKAKEGVHPFAVVTDDEKNNNTNKVFPPQGKYLDVELPRHMQRDREIPGLSSRYMRGEAPEIEHLAAPQWSTAVFLKQLAYHALCPLSTPFLFLVEPLPLVRNMGYCFELSPAFVFNYFFQGLVLYVDVLFVLKRGGWIDGGANAMYDFELVALNAAHFMRYLMIAVKYAYVLSDPWWLERLTTRALSQEERGSLLLAVWNNPSHETMARELKIAEQRVGERLSAHRIHGGGGSDGGDAAGITVHDFCERMVLSASKVGGGAALWTMSFSFAYAMAPTVYRLSEGVPMTHWTDVSMIAISTVVTTIMYNAVIFFLVASLADFRRRAMLEQALSIVISDTLRDTTMIALHRKHTLSPTERFIRGLDLPSIELTVPSNVRAFMLIHEVFRVLGAEFSERIAVYNSGIALLNVLLLVLLIGQIISGDGSGFEPVTLFYVFATVGSLSLMLARMGVAGARANAEAAVQRHTLLRIKARVQVAMAECELAADVPMMRGAIDGGGGGGEKATATTTTATSTTTTSKTTAAAVKTATMGDRVRTRMIGGHVERVLSTAVDLIESDDQLQPLRILGVRASGSALSGFLGGMLTTVALILQVVSSA